MIQFTRVDNKVIVKLEHGIWGDGSHFTLEIQCQHPYSAELLMRQFQEELRRRIKATREEYYNQGWKDAKGKKNAKLKYFHGYKF